MLGQIAQLPFSLITSLLSVLIVAVPALFYERGEVVTIEAAWQLVIGRFWRYLLAGVFFSVVMTIGFFLCILPGIAVALVTPVYVNRIFVTEMSIGEESQMNIVIKKPRSLTQTSARFSRKIDLLAVVISMRCPDGRIVFFSALVSSRVGPMW